MLEKDDEHKPIKLTALTVTANEFRKYLNNEPSSFDFEYLEVDWLLDSDIEEIKSHLNDVADVYKTALIRKHKDDKIED